MKRRLALLLIKVDYVVTAPTTIEAVERFRLSLGSVRTPTERWRACSTRNPDRCSARVVLGSDAE